MVLLVNRGSKRKGYKACRDLFTLPLVRSPTSARSTAVLGQLIVASVPSWCIVMFRVLQFKKERDAYEVGGW